MSDPIRIDPSKPAPASPAITQATTFSVGCEAPVPVTFFTRCAICGAEDEWTEHRTSGSLHPLTAMPPLERGRFFTGRTLGCAKCGTSR